MKKRIFPAILLSAGVGLALASLSPDLLLNPKVMMFLSGVPLALMGLFRLIFIQRVKKCVHFSTTLTSFGLSAAASGILIFALLSVAPMFLDGPSIRNPLCEKGFVVFLALFLLLLGLYIFFRCRRPSALGFLLDVVRGVIFLPAVGWGILLLMELIENIFHVNF